MLHRHLQAPLFILAIGLLVGCGSSDGSVGAAQDETNPEPDAAIATDAGVEQQDAAEELPPEPDPSCNFILQDCDPGLNCTFQSSDDDQATCVDSGLKGYGADCAGTSDCEFGICISLNDTDSKCYKFCKTPKHCPEDSQCLELQDSKYRVCEISGLYTSCNLLADDCEETGKSCYLHGDEGPVCLPAGTSGLKEDCESAADCAPGHTCINLNCLRLCNQNEPSPCGDAFTPCAGYYGVAGYCDE
mgnify:CR=1 FL=1